MNAREQRSYFHVPRQTGNTQTSAKPKNTASTQQNTTATNQPHKTTERYRPKSPWLRTERHREGRLSRPPPPKYLSAGSLSALARPGNLNANLDRDQTVCA